MHAIHYIHEVPDLGWKNARSENTFHLETINCTICLHAEYTETVWGSFPSITVADIMPGELEITG